MATSAAPPHPPCDPAAPPAAAGEPTLLDERSRPDFRTVYGRLFGRSDRVDVAIRRIRLAGMTLGPPELRAPARVRVLLAEINVLTLGAEADAMAVTRDGRTRLELLLDLLDREALRVRSAPLGGWAPDFSVFHLRELAAAVPGDRDSGFRNRAPPDRDLGDASPPGRAVHRPALDTPALDVPEPGPSGCPEPARRGRPEPGDLNSARGGDRATDRSAGPPEGPAPGPVLLTGLHWFERPYPHRGPALASLHRGPGAARIAARFHELWNAGHDVSPAIRRILAAALARVPEPDPEPARRSAREYADQPRPIPTRDPLSNQPVSPPTGARDPVGKGGLGH